jgi:hypothetical protein
MIAGWLVQVFYPPQMFERPTIFNSSTYKIKSCGLEAVVVGSTLSGTFCNFDWNGTGKHIVYKRETGMYVRCEAAVLLSLILTTREVAFQFTPW